MKIESSHSTRSGRMLAALPAFLFALVLLLPAPLTLAAQQPVPVGPEFQVNSYTTGPQYGAEAAMDPNGAFVVVWTSLGQDGSNGGIFGRRFDSSGQPTGSEFRANSYTTGAQNWPSVGIDDTGNFVVVWASFGQDGATSGIFGQRFASNGLSAGLEFQVNTWTTGFQRRPEVGVAPSGDFIVTWTSFGEDGSSGGIFGQMFESGGIPVGGEFLVNSYTSGIQSRTSVAARLSGAFIVTWTSGRQDGSQSGVFARRFSSLGTVVGSEFTVNSFTSGAQSRPDIAMDFFGRYIVSWTSFGQDQGIGGVFARRFDGSGAALGPDFQVNSYTTGLQNRPSVAVDQVGDFVVTWEGAAFQDGYLSGIFGQAFSRTGTPVGSEFQVNTHAAGQQSLPSAAAGPPGKFVVVWDSYRQDGNNGGVFAQQFHLSLNCTLGDSDADLACDETDNCPDLYNPAQDDSDLDGTGDACDVVVTTPLAGAGLDCSDPGLTRPTIAWTPGPYDRFRVVLSADQLFSKGSRVSSGDKALKLPTWTPSRKKWKKACRKAMNQNPSNPVLYIRVQGIDRDIPKSNPMRRNFSQVVLIGVGL